MRTRHSIQHYFYSARTRLGQTGQGVTSRWLGGVWRALGERITALHPRWALNLWTAAARLGDAKAAFLVGEAVLNGRGATNRPATAAHWYRQAAQAGHVRAQCRLAQLHLGGYSEAVLRNEALFALPAEPQEPDYAAALPWAHAAAQTGDAEGQTLLGQILANAPPELRDEAASIAAYAAAAAQRHAPAQLGLGIALLLRARSPEDWETAYKEIAAAAEAGLPAAYYLLGLCAEKGLGQTPDTAAAQKHYTVAAEAGIVAAQTRLGCMLINARASNLVGETWLRRAALRGDTEAATLVGQLHAGDAEAVQWFRMAAEGGGLTGAFNYARCLATGSGVPRDMAGATFWLTNAAEAGFAEAQAALGAAHIDGQDVPRDIRRAKLWLLRAAKTGHAGAMFTLGVLYINTSTSSVGRTAARRWLEKAATNGHALAPVLLAKTQ